MANVKRQGGKCPRPCDAVKRKAAAEDIRTGGL